MPFSVEPFDVTRPYPIPRIPPYVVTEKSLPILELIKKEIAIGGSLVELDRF